MAKASITNPVYRAFLVADQGANKYEITEAMTGLKITDADGELAPKVNVSFVNQYIDGKWFNTMFTVGDVVQVYADNGDGEKLLGNYLIWTKDYSSKDQKILSVTGYDRKLIYLQKSQDVRFYEKGKSTKAIIADICGAWGVTMQYSYESINHELMQWRGSTLAEMIFDLLEEVRVKNGTRFCFYSTPEGALVINYRGTNDTVYEFAAKKNALSTSSTITLENIVTRIKIYSNGDEGKRDKLEATVDGEVTKYGTLQKIITKSSNTKLADSKKEADQTIKDDGHPHEIFTLNTIDIPFIKKGDKIKVAAGDMLGDFYVLSIQHDCTNKQMSLECEQKRAKDK